MMDEIKETTPATTEEQKTIQEQLEIIAGWLERIGDVLEVISVNCMR